MWHTRLATLWLVVGCVGVAVVGTGCSGIGVQRGPVVSVQSSPPPLQAAKPTTGIEEAVQGQAQRLSRAMARSERRQAPPAPPAPPEPVSQVRWLRAGAVGADGQGGGRTTTQQTASRRRSAPSSEPITRSEGQGPGSEPGVALVKSSGSSIKPVSDKVMPRPPTRQVLLAQLRDRIRAEDVGAMQKAIAAAGLSLAEPGQALDSVDLKGLDPKQREMVQRYQRLVKALGQQLIHGDEGLDAQGIMDEVERVWEEQAIRIREVKLCRRVQGYGVYDEFEDHTFLVGRENPMIVYVELDRFRSKETGGNQYQVKLAQEIVLYNESDGLAVWQQPRVDIVDESFNRRRDFFVVQLLRLPERLSVGRYQLKVRITDLHGQSVEEAMVPVRIVADRSLANNNTKPD